MSEVESLPVFGARVREAQAELGLNAAQFAQKIGVSRAAVGIWRNRDLASSAVCGKITHRFPQFSLSWLMTGEGEMLSGVVVSTDLPAATGALAKMAPQLLRSLADSLDAGEITALKIRVDRRTFDVRDPEPGENLVPWLRVIPTDEMSLEFKYKIEA